MGIPSTDIKEFEIQDPDTGKTFKVNMTIIDYMNYKALLQIAEAIRNHR